LKRLLDPHEIHTESLVKLAFFGIIVNTLSILFFHQYIQMRSESKQVHLDFKQRIQRIFFDNLPCMSVILTSYLVQKGRTWSFVDPLMAIFILIKVLRVVIPLSKDTGRVLLQATPSQSKDSLYKTILQASTAEGVLEIKNAHFWTQSPGVIVASLIVRVRADANEQSVLAAISPLFSRFVTHLTIQIEKSDWGLPPLF